MDTQPAGWRGCHAGDTTNQRHSPVMSMEARMRFSTIGERRAGSSVRLYTHNIFGRHAGWEQRREVLKEGIETLEPDVLLFQETIVEDGYDQLAELLDPVWHVVHSEARGDEGIGISIASRWPIAWTRELDLTLVSPRDG